MSTQKSNCLIGKIICRLNTKNFICSPKHVINERLLVLAIRFVIAVFQDFDMDGFGFLWMQNIFEINFKA